MLIIFPLSPISFFPKLQNVLAEIAQDAATASIVMSAVFYYKRRMSFQMRVKS